MALTLALFFSCFFPVQSPDRPRPPRKRFLGEKEHLVKQISKQISLVSQYVNMQSKQHMHRFIQICTFCVELHTKKALQQ